MNSIKNNLLSLGVVESVNNAIQHTCLWMLISGYKLAHLSDDQIDTSVKQKHQ